MPTRSHPTSAPAVPDIFDSAQAAEYIGYCLQTIKYHLYTTGCLKPNGYLGRTPYFTRDTLDSFKIYLGELKPGPKVKNGNGNGHKHK